MFCTEDELRDSFLGVASPHLWAPTARFDFQKVLRERSWAEGRADAVWAGISGELNPCTAAAAVMRDPVASRIVAELRPRRGRSEERLLQVSGVSRPSFRPTLWRAVEEGLVRKTASGLFVLGEAFPNWTVELCAFEFKLANWRRAFYQALRYRAFAHRVYIVMPSNNTERVAQDAERFRIFGIGLIEHAADGSNRVLVRVRKQQPRSRSSYVRAIADLVTAG